MVLEGDGEWTLVEKKITMRKSGPRLLDLPSTDTRPPKQSKNPTKDQDSVAIGNHFNILNEE